MKRITKDTIVYTRYYCNKGINSSDVSIDLKHWGPMFDVYDDGVEDEYNHDYILDVMLGINKKGNLSNSFYLSCIKRT